MALLTFHVSFRGCGRPWAGSLGAAATPGLTPIKRGYPGEGAAVAWRARGRDFSLLGTGAAYGDCGSRAETLGLRLLFRSGFRE